MPLLAIVARPRCRLPPSRGWRWCWPPGPAAAVPPGGEMVDGLRHRRRSGLRGSAGRRRAGRGSPLRAAAGSESRPRRSPGAASLDVAALVPAAIGSQLVGRRLGPDPADPYPPQIRVSRLRGAARAYSIAVWPLLWAVCEEATYLGYAFPRLERRYGVGRSAALVSLAWAAQHAVMPVLPGRRYALSRVAAMLPVSAAFTTVYLARAEGWRRWSRPTGPRICPLPCWPPALTARDATTMTPSRLITDRSEVSPRAGTLSRRSARQFESACCQLCRTEWSFCCGERRCACDRQVPVT